MKKTNLFIEKLDQGFVVSENGKKQAVPDAAALRNMLHSKVMEISNSVLTANTSIIRIDCEVNPPQQG